MSKLKLVFVGYGLAVIRCVEEIIKVNPKMFEIIIFADQRIHQMVLEGDTSVDFQTSNDWSWNKKRNILHFSGETIVNMDLEKQIVYSNQHREINYDRLILATGSAPFLLPPYGNYKIAVGMKPNIQLAFDSGLPVNRGILVNDFMEAYYPNVYALGECAEHRNIVYRLAQQITEQSKVLAMRVCGMVSNPFQGSFSSDTVIPARGINEFENIDISFDKKNQILVI
jgi:NAD(P)H-nitrite reductase large subunit